MEYPSLRLTGPRLAPLALAAERRRTAPMSAMADSGRSRVIPFTEALDRIPGLPGAHFVTVLERGTVRALLSRPVSPNRQTPHVQDEIYVIARGRGVLFHDGRRDRFEAGDFIFVAAGTEHWFEDFTEDFAVWVVFHGPPGGEVPPE
jgi:mannose-6-phosphate isomerase-like protein (cupin superfamily)